MFSIPNDWDKCTERKSVCQCVCFEFAIVAAAAYAHCVNNDLGLLFRNVSDSPLWRLSLVQTHTRTGIRDTLIAIAAHQPLKREWKSVNIVQLTQNIQCSLLCILDGVISEWICLAPIIYSHSNRDNRKCTMINVAISKIKVDKWNYRICVAGEVFSYWRWDIASVGAYVSVCVCAEA